MVMLGLGFAKVEVLRLLFVAKCSICLAYHGENKLYFNEMMMMSRSVVDRHD